MKRIHKVLVWILTLTLVLGTVGMYPVKVKASINVGESFTLKIGCLEGMQIPENYGIEYTFYKPDGGKIEGGDGYLKGSDSGAEVSRNISVPDGASKVEIKVISAGNDVYTNGSKDNGWSGGKPFYLPDEINQGQVFQFQLQPASGPGPGPGPGPDDGGQGGSIDVDLNVSWGGNTSIGEIIVGGVGIPDISSTSEYHLSSIRQLREDQIEIFIRPEFTESFNSVKVNGVEQLTEGQVVSDEAGFSFSIPKDTRNVSIEVAKGTQTDYTIVWGYDLEQVLENYHGDDAYVEHGKVMVLDGYKSGNSDQDGGFYRAEAGRNVVIKLIPDYGYQVVGAKINGEVDLDAAQKENEFVFEMPATNVHFKGIFTKTSDIVDNSSSAIKGASFDGKNVAASGGTAKMSIANATPASTASVNNIDTSKDVQAVDITMDQLFYKNSPSDVWSTNKTELSAPAQVSLTVGQDADDYAVLRTHNGVVEAIPARYDAEKSELVFASAQYSTYTLVPLKKNGTEPEIPYGLTPEEAEHVKTLNEQWFDKGGKSFWYENGIRQGTEDDPKGVMGFDAATGQQINRGREICDIKGNSWCWLDSIYQGAKATNKEVWVPYIYQEEANWNEEEIWQNANASGPMAKQVHDAILCHGKEGAGKWVRYDANGTMIKGWYTVEGEDCNIYPNQVGNTYYYDYKTGLMAKGWVTIDGVNYHFDEVTGVKTE